MKHKTATPWIFSSLAALALTCGAQAIETVETIDGERYEGIEVLKVEEDGVIVKHTRGIAKIPFFELDETTRKQFGHTGETTPPILHAEPPQTSLLPDIEGAQVDPADLDLDVDRSAEEQAVSSPSISGKASREPQSRRVDPPSTRLRTKTKPVVSVSAVGVARDPLFARGANGRYLLGLPIHDQKTTKYTPYGNYTYEGSSGHWYGYYGRNVCNRCLFERRDYRRWQHGR